MNIYFYEGQRPIGQTSFEKMKVVPRIGEKICMDYQEGYEDPRLVIFDVVYVRYSVPNEGMMGKPPILDKSSVNIGLKKTKGMNIDE